MKLQKVLNLKCLAFLRNLLFNKYIAIYDAYEILSKAPFEVLKLWQKDDNHCTDLLVVSSLGWVLLDLHQCISREICCASLEITPKGVGSR